jgi:3-hydroxyisobutyrate dehydrogenase-like beta-hydroxyacid dehydrogenase
MVRPLSRTIERIGLLGCGRMGAAMGGHLLDAGTPLAVYDPVAEACADLVARGAFACSSAGEVASQSDLVLVVVVDDEQTRAAVAACLETAAPDTVLALCASIRPDTCVALAQLAAERGMRVIDAALVRGERGAEAGELALFCGGDVEAIDAVRAAARPFAADVVRVGEVGAGQVAKTANNILLWANIRADVEAMRLGRALGVEPAALREAMALGSGANKPLADWGKHRLRWPHKDLEVAVGLAAEAGVDVPLVASLRALLEELSVEDLHELL